MVKPEGGRRRCKEVNEWHSQEKGMKGRKKGRIETGMLVVGRRKGRMEEGGRERGEGLDLAGVAMLSYLTSNENY